MSIFNRASSATRDILFANEIFNKIRVKNLLIIGVGIGIGTLIGAVLTNSLVIGLAFGTVSSIAPHIYLERKVENSRKKLQKLWPEILDHLISGLKVLRRPIF